MNTKPEITLGCKAKDKITGFTGIVIAMTSWLNGCQRVTIQPQELKDGKPIEAHTFDVQQIELLQCEVIREAVTDKPPGGPAISPVRNADPK